MRSIKDSIIDFIQSEDIKRDVLSMVQPVYTNIYNELYPYLWFICIYMVILTFIILANLVLLMRVLNTLGGFYISEPLS
jgi:hypothetical protein|tara:strand:- start:422 stop:658 length:237 start_codon:yes stop_codon:yes gene_type:complete